MRRLSLAALAAAALLLLLVTAAQPQSSGANRDSFRQDFLKLKFGMFLHFNVATFADREWATGYEDPAIFAPAKLDCRQWASAAKDAGMNYAVLTVKHTGGWCLWDSKYTTHDITAFKNFRKGKGDLAREFVDAFRARGLKVGFYYCFPGDFASNKKIGHPIPAGKPDLHGLPAEAIGDYVGFMKKQLAELLTNYGPIEVLWIDQYPNKYTVSSWQDILAYVHSLQPRTIVVANNAGSLDESDVLSFEFPWKPDRLPPEGNRTPAEIADTIDRKGWFWHPAAPEDVKPADALVKMLRMANERSANYILNVPPDRDGLISGARLERLREVGRLLGTSR
jgi:alpha-L-fucosidase